MRKRLPKVSRAVLGYCLITLLVIGSAAAYIWNTTVKQAEPQVFYNAIQASMTSKGLTCEISKKDLQASSQQRISLDLQSGTDARSVTTLSQQNAKVVTHGIATKNDDYVKYTVIEAPGENKRDFSKVLGVWGKQSRADLGGTSLYDQAAFGGCVVPLANLPPDKAAKLMSEVRQGHIFKTDTTRAKRTQFDGRPVYEYEVILTGPVYIKFVKKVAAAANVKSLEKIDEETYAERAAEKLTFKINRNSHRIEQIVYAGGQQKITFSNYGERQDIAAPTKTISTVELQKRLESVK